MDIFHIKSFFEIIPPSARDRYLFFKKPFLFNLDSSDEEVIVIAVVAKGVVENKPRKKRKRKLRVKPWLQRRSQLEVFNTLLQEMKLEDPEGSKNVIFVR